jgi:ATP-dependent helicase/nuclease subunit B
VSLTLIHGRANTGKTGILHGVLRDALARGSAPVLLLPTMPDVRRTESELGRDGLVGARVGTLDGWIQELWALHGDGRRPIGPAARAALLERAISEARPRRLAASAASPGFIWLLAEVVARMTRPPGPAQGQYAEIGAIIDRYLEAADGEGLVEPAFAARLLGEDPPTVVGPVLVNRFTALSEGQEALLRGIGTRAEVAVALTWDPDLPGTVALDPLVERMFDTASRVPLASKPPSNELGYLEDRLFCPGEPIIPSGMLRLGLAGGEDAESVLAARFARGLLDDGVAAERIAIVFHDVARRLPSLVAALTAEGITSEFDMVAPVASTQFGTAFANLIGACISPSRERILAVLLSPYSNAEPARVLEADVRWRGRRTTGERLLREAAALDSGTAAAFGAARRAVSRGLTPASAADWAGAADALLAATEPALGADDATILDAAAHRAMLSAFDEVAALTDVKLEPRAVLGLLSRASASSGVGERAGAVQVTEVHRLRSRRFDAVILGGLSWSEFSAERDTPLSAEIAERLGAAPGLAELDAERMLFYLVVTRAREKLVLLRQETDARGEPSRPSVFWDEVIDLYVEDEQAGEDALAVPPGIEPVRLSAAHADAPPAYAPGRRAQRAAAEARRPAPRGALRDEDTIAALAGRQEFSVTELEAYLTCPYRWFFERSLALRELDVEVDAREKGSRAHELLAAFYGALEPELGLRRVGPDTLGEALALLDRVDERLEQAARFHAIGLREELALAEGRRQVRALIEDDAWLLPGFEPLELEFKFGSAEERPFALAGVSLRGSVDRIDRGADGLVVTDYKSGEVRGMSSFGTKHLIQVAVYAQAARELLGGEVAGAWYRSLKDLRIRGVRLRGTDVGGRGSARDIVEDASGMDPVFAAAAEAVVEAARGIRTGDITPQPSADSHCGTCGARMFCEVVG